MIRNREKKFYCCRFRRAVFTTYLNLRRYDNGTYDVGFFAVVAGIVIYLLGGVS